ncbi:hypothetical protein SMICM17S_03054 [Streptomyces microflavus]
MRRARPRPRIRANSRAVAALALSTAALTALTACGAAPEEKAATGANGVKSTEAASFVYRPRTEPGPHLRGVQRHPSADGFTESLFLSLSLAAATIALALLLVVPALVAVRLGPPRLQGVVEVVCSGSPLAVRRSPWSPGSPPSCAGGRTTSRAPRSYQTFLAVQNESFPVVLVLAYTVLALPFVHRSLDAGLRASTSPRASGGP